MVLIWPLEGIIHESTVYLFPPIKIFLCVYQKPYMFGMNPDSKIHVEGVAATDIVLLQQVWA